MKFAGSLSSVPPFRGYPFASCVMCKKLWHNDLKCHGVGVRCPDCGLEMRNISQDEASSVVGSKLEAG